jgi:drug/metabolite transporter (DMT)-like permease
MAAPESKEYLDLRAVITILLVTMLWGFNHTTIKYSNQGISPIFASTLRSIVASACGVIYCLQQKQS